MTTPVDLAIVTDADLDAATDAQLDANLTRLYHLHLDLIGDERDECHAAIMLLVGEFGRRLDAWLAAR